VLQSSRFGCRFAHDDSMPSDRIMRRVLNAPTIIETSVSGQPEKAAQASMSNPAAEPRGLLWLAWSMTAHHVAATLPASTPASRPIRIHLGSVGAP
jgi:hypothetical protein